MQMTEAERNAKSTIKKDEGFQMFMSKPETKLMLSLVPESSTPDAVAILLRGSFEAGHANGVGEMMALMLDAVLNDKPSNRF